LKQEQEKKMMPTNLMNDSMSPKKSSSLQQPQATNAPQEQQVCCYSFMLAVGIATDIITLAFCPIAA